MGEPETIVKKGHRGEEPGPGPYFARAPGGNLDNRMESETGGQTVRERVYFLRRVMLPLRVWMETLAPPPPVENSSSFSDV